MALASTRSCPAAGRPEINRLLLVADDPAAFMGRSIRTERWCYIEWDGGREGVELYDAQEDPRQLRNAADDPKRKATVMESQAKLRAHTPR